MKLRFYLALLLTKLMRVAMRLLGRNATLLPGTFALRICPQFLALVAKPQRIIVVTGTNGKTTVANLVRDACEQLGEATMGNRLGSNTAAGIASAFIPSTTLGNRSRFHIAVLEVDERFSPKILPAIKPTLVLVTNLFRDSIMRNAHPEFIAGFLSRAIPPNTSLLLNADDPISAALCPDNPRRYFGIGEVPGDTVACTNLINDMRICPRCATELVYDYRHYHHIGRCHCPACDYASPARDYTATALDFAALGMELGFPDGTHLSAGLLSDNLFNAYNQLSATAALCELGFEPARAVGALAQVGIVESRYNEQKAGATTVVMQMSKDKNALAGSRAFDYVASREGQKELVLMMNCLNDLRIWSENTCWLYDCDFELLNKPDISRIVATGPRATDYYLRLLLAGIPEERLRCVAHEMEAPEALELPAGGSVYVFYGTDSIKLAYQVRDRIGALAQERVGATGAGVDAAGTGAGALGAGAAAADAADKSAAQGGERS